MMAIPYDSPAHMFRRYKDWEIEEETGYPFIWEKLSAICAFGRERSSYGSSQQLQQKGLSKRKFGRAFEPTEGTSELGDFGFSFTSLLLAFLVANDAFGRWFQNYLSESRPQLEISQDMSRNIKNFSKREDQIRNLIVTGGRKFSNNPRDVKRFVDVFRFFCFRRVAREARKEPAPSLDQRSRWIVLPRRWPEVVRWLRRTSAANGFATDSVFREFKNTARARTHQHHGKWFRLHFCRYPNRWKFGPVQIRVKLLPCICQPCSVSRERKEVHGFQTTCGDR